MAQPKVSEQANALKFAKVLASVAEDLRIYALAIEHGANPGNWEGSTYALEAQGAVYKQMVADGELT